MFSGILVFLHTLSTKENMESLRVYLNICMIETHMSYLYFLRVLFYEH